MDRVGRDMLHVDNNISRQLNDQTRYLERNIDQVNHHVRDAQMETIRANAALTQMYEHHQHRHERNHGHVLRDISDTRGCLEKTILITNAEAQRHASDNRSLLAQQICKTTGDLERQAADNKAQLQLQMCSSFGNVERQAADYRHSIERQASDNKNHLQLQMSEARLSQERQAAEYKLSLELDAHRNREAIQRQLAECCCEIKEKVIKESCATREVISEQNNNRYRDSLIESRNENMFLRFANSNNDRSPGPTPPK
jgi:hypothetical protein